jgi:predicted anti-sigma-YlaC factor YlaD
VKAWLTCREASALLSRAQDARIGALARARVRLHLLVCDACRNFERNLAIVREAIRRYAR